MSTFDAICIEIVIFGCGLGIVVALREAVLELRNIGTELKRLK